MEHSPQLVGLLIYASAAERITDLLVKLRMDVQRVKMLPRVLIQ
jgi:hypothetical protein